MCWGLEQYRLCFQLWAIWEQSDAGGLPRYPVKTLIHLVLFFYCSVPFGERCFSVRIENDGRRRIEDLLAPLCFVPTICIFSGSCLFLGGVPLLDLLEYVLRCLNQFLAVLSMDLCNVEFL